MKTTQTTPTRSYQNTSDIDALYADAAVAKVELDALVNELAAELGADALCAPLKGRARAMQKAASKEKGISTLTDIARASLVCDTVADVFAALAVVEGRVAEITRNCNRFENPIHGYRDIILNARLANGHIVELQIHVRAILVVKNGAGHTAYECFRAAGDSIIDQLVAGAAIATSVALYNAAIAA